MDWSYIAGFFDGEGSIVKLRQANGSYRIAFAQGNRSVLEQIKLVLDGYNIHSWITNKKPSKEYPNSVGYHLAFSSAPSVRLFLETVLPYLIVKRKQAIETLEKLTHRTLVSEAERHAMVALHNLGLSHIEIGNFLGRARSTVDQHLRRRVCP